MYKIPPEDFEKIYSKVPRLCVDLVIISDEGILLTKRAINPFKGYWHLPGGGLEFNEKIEDAVKRLAKKELDLEIPKYEIIDILEYLNEEHLKIKRHSVAVIILIKILHNKIKLNEEATDFKFFKTVPKDVYPDQKEYLMKNGYLS